MPKALLTLTDESTGKESVVFRMSSRKPRWAKTGTRNEFVQVLLKDESWSDPIFQSSSQLDFLEEIENIHPLALEHIPSYLDTKQMTEAEIKLKDLALRIIYDEDPGTSYGYGRSYEQDKYQGKESVAYEILEVLNIDEWTGKEKV